MEVELSAFHDSNGRIGYQIKAEGAPVGLGTSPDGAIEDFVTRLRELRAWEASCEPLPRGYPVTIDLDLDVPDWIYKSGGIPSDDLGRT